MTTQSCSDRAAEVEEQLLGSAPHAAAWVALEQAGTLGPQGVHREPPRPGPAGGWRPRRRSTTYARPWYAVPAGADDAAHRADDGRRVLVAHTAPGRSWLLDGTVARPEELLDLDWPALREGDRDAVRRSLPTLAASDRAHLLVCTNGRRDVCCAVKGRPLALGMAALHPDRVWEVTHTSGHRFAPTAVLLPAGTCTGGSTRGRRAAPGRGRPWRDRPGRQPGPLDVAGGGPGRRAGRAGARRGEPARRPRGDGVRSDAEHRWTVDVAHVDGRSWRLGWSRPPRRSPGASPAARRP